MHYEFDIKAQYDNCVFVLQPQAEGPCSRPRSADLCRQYLAPVWALVRVCCSVQNCCSSLLMAWLEWPPLLRIWSTQLCVPKHLGELQGCTGLKAQMCKNYPFKLKSCHHLFLLPNLCDFVEHEKKIFWKICCFWPHWLLLYTVKKIIVILTV